MARQNPVTGVRDLTIAKGNCGVQIWQKAQGEITHIWVVSSWTDYESIKAFAGNNIERARYYEEDQKYLQAFETNGQHFEAGEFGLVN